MSTAASETTADRRRWIALAVVVAAQFIVILDVAIVNVALPSIKTDLHFSEQGLQWVITAYAIVFGGALLLGGRLGDVLGRRRIFIVGLVVFAVSSLLCGVAWSESSLIAFRAVQGLGGALLAPAALSLLMTTFGEARREVGACRGGPRGRARRRPRARTSAGAPRGGPRTRSASEATRTPRSPGRGPPPSRRRRAPPPGSRRARAYGAGVAGTRSRPCPAS